MGGRRTCGLAVALFAGGLLLQNCATIASGTRQRVPVSSRPPGAKVFVDGKESGYAPLILRLSKKTGHVIRIEKEGYNPLEIRISRDAGYATFASDFGNFFLAAALAAATGFAVGSAASDDQEAVGLVVGLFSFPLYIQAVSIADRLIGGPYGLSPSDLQVTLTAIRGQPRTDVTFVDGRRWIAVRWVRVGCEDE